MRPFPGSLLTISSDEMCYRLIERYAVCRCRYYVHAIDPCILYGYKGHSAEDRILLVGYLCSRHERLEHAGSSCPVTEQRQDSNNPITENNEGDWNGRGDNDEDNEFPYSNLDHYIGESESNLQVANSRTRETGRTIDTQRGPALHGRRRATFPSILWNLRWLSRSLGR